MPYAIGRPIKGIERGGIYPTEPSSEGGPSAIGRPIKGIERGGIHTTVGLVAVVQTLSDSVTHSSGGDAGAVATAKLGRGAGGYYGG